MAVSHAIVQTLRNVSVFLCDLVELLATFASDEWNLYSNSPRTKGVEQEAPNTKCILRARSHVPCWMPPKMHTFDVCLETRSPFWKATRRPPEGDRRGVEARRQVCLQIRKVYVNLVQSGVFISRNILEARSSEYTLHPSIDSMGVVYGASELIKHRIPADAIGAELDDEEANQFALKMRIAMAAALFVSYKVASEETWSCKGSSIAAYVLLKFVHPTELSPKELKLAPAIMMEAELDLLCALDLYSILEFNIEKLVEYKLQALVHARRLSPHASIQCLCVSSFYFGVVFTWSDEHSETVETSCEQHGGDTVAESILLVCLATICSSFTIHPFDLPLMKHIVFRDTAVDVAKRVLLARLGSSFLPSGFPSLCSVPVAAKALAYISNAELSDGRLGSPVSVCVE